MSVTGETSARPVGTHVFLSYSKTDRAFAEATCAKLESAGIRCWMAPRDIMPGAIWGEAIIDAIITSQLMILVFSRAANKSQQVAREVERAASRNVPLLPLRIEDVPLSKALELYLSTSQWLDAFTPPREQHLDRLVKAVKKLLGSAATAPPRIPSQDAVPRISVPVPGQGAPARKRNAIAALAAGAIALSAAGVWALSSFGGKNSPPNPTLSIAGPKRLSQVIGDTFTLRAALDQALPGKSVITWESADTSVVRIERSRGVAVAIARGSARLYATTVTSKDSVLVDVQPRLVESTPAIDSPPVVSSPAASNRPSVASVQLTRPTKPLHVGDSLALSARPLDSAGRPLKMKVTWRSSAPNVATVDPSHGMLRGVASGQSTITANAGATSAAVSISVVEKELVSQPPVRPMPETTVKNTTTSPPLAATTQRTLAEACIAALRKPDQAWLSAHYAAATTGDQANLSALVSLVGKRGYAAQEIPLATADRLTDFQIRFSYVTSFGPKRTTDAVFKVTPSLNNGRWEVASCRVDGRLIVP
jgi:hypothetical protein